MKPIKHTIHQISLLALLAGTMAFTLFAAEPVVPQQTSPQSDGRTTISLNGTWQIAESVSADGIPTVFDHTVVVPGMVNLAKPAFPDVDLFASHEYLIRWGNKYPWGGPDILAKDAPLPVIGISMQQRNYFWYRTTFTAPEKRQVVLLKINKSQFGTKVWLNGKAVGEHPGCWTSGTFNLTDALNASGENQLLVRIGAHPAVLPESQPGAGMYSSKHKWTPGIYDDVSLILCDNPVIETIQVAPRIDNSEVVVQTKVRNHGPARVFDLTHKISTWNTGKEVARTQSQRENIGAGEEKTFTQTIRIPDARLWSPEDPFLYSVESRTGGDSVRTRFGMREYRFDNAKSVGYLNGKPYYLRGGNIELHLHFEDPLCGETPWNRAWVRKLIAEIPKKLGWNTFRFSMSPVPDMWLDIADEEGMLIQYEPPLWTYPGGTRPQWDPNEFIKEFGLWMSDNWNHPCLFMWDSNNKCSWDDFAKIINTVRPLDLSNRAWDNGFCSPATPADPRESHEYVTPTDYRTFNTFERKREGRCVILNEYAWLWLYADGEPIDIARGGFDKIPAAERQEYRFYITAAMTEMWRSERFAIGVLDYQYLGSYLPRKTGPYHFGDFKDITTLQLHPEFEKYMGEALKPLGVYLKFWGEGEPGPAWHRDPWFSICGGAAHTFPVVLINDDPEPVAGKLVLTVESPDGRKLASSEKPFQLDGAGRNAYELSVPIPKETGKYLLKAVAYPEGSRHKSPTVSLRKLSVERVVDAKAKLLPGETKDNALPTNDPKDLLKPQ
ncbi:MAG: beta galactosidase jelly roll domain-containing protein [Akkermansiaceae bacterium]|nr:beta galactosidase jelly roll domain-containing protein [Akkermansiaceae bacterium]